MSERGNPYDNAFVESFIRTLKYEEVYLNEYETFSDALDNIAHFIDDVYNKKRLHSAIGYRSPIDFEKEKEREMEKELKTSAVLHNYLKTVLFFSFCQSNLLKSSFSKPQKK